MKILYVTTIGMTMRFFKPLINDLISQGHTVDIATNEKYSRIPDCYREWGCKVYPISTSRSPFSYGNIRAIKQIKKIALGYDIVHCHTPLAGMATRLGCRSLRKKGLKVIYTAHGFHFYNGAPKKNWLIYYPIEKICSKWTDALITINKEDYDISNEKMKAKYTYYVHGVGIDVDKFVHATGNKERFCGELNIPLDSKILVSVGELNVNKNHKIVIQALKKLNDAKIHYVIAGIGDQKENLAKMARDLNVNLHLLGYRSDIAEIYKSSDICLFPSIREGLGLAALEGFSAGLPVICSDNRGTRELKDLNVIMCKYNDVNDFCEAIRNVLENNISRVDSNLIYEFDVKTVNKKMLSIYSEIINSK